MHAEKRVVNILGAQADKMLPCVSNETLKVYHNYLSKELSFPFDAEYSFETGHLRSTYYDVKVRGILDINECSDTSFYGLFCKAMQGRHKIVVPLAEIEVKQKGKNKQLIDDYRMWFWNYR